MTDELVPQEQSALEQTVDQEIAEQEAVFETALGIAMITLGGFGMGAGMYDVGPLLAPFIVDGGARLRAYVQQKGLDRYNALAAGLLSVGFVSTVASYARYYDSIVSEGHTPLVAAATLGIAGLPALGAVHALRKALPVNSHTALSGQEDLYLDSSHQDLES